MLEKFVKISINNISENFHWHDVIELIFVLRGSINVTLNNREYQLEHDDLLVLNCDDVHSIKLLSENPLYVSFHINVYEFNQYIPNISNVLFKCSPDIYKEMLEDVSFAIKELVSKSIIDLVEQEEAYENKVIFYIISILNILRNTFNVIGKNPEDYRSLEQFERVWQVVEYVYANYNRKLTLGELANHVHVSENYLSHVIKDSLGMYFEEFLSFVRAEQSVRYLITTDLSLTTIAYECGFSAPRYFNTYFKKIYKCLPGEYRANNKKKIEQVKANALESSAFEATVPKEEYYESLIGYIAKENNASGTNVHKIDISFPSSLKKACVIKFAGAGLGRFIEDVPKDWMFTINGSTLNLPKSHLLFDTAFAGPFIAKQLLDHGDYAAEYIERNIEAYGQIGNDFNGDFTLFTANGIKKPIYHAIKLLSSVGRDVLEQRENHFICRNEDTINLILFNYPKSIENIGLDKVVVDSDQRTNHFLSDPIFKFIVTVRNLNVDKIYNITRIKLSKEGGSILDLLDNQRAIDYLESEEINYFKNCCEPKLTFKVVKNQECYSSFEYLEPNSLQIIRIRARQHTGL